MLLTLLARFSLVKINGLFIHRLSSWAVTHSNEKVIVTVVSPGGYVNFVNDILFSFWEK